MIRRLILVPAFAFLLVACTSEPTEAPIATFVGIWQEDSDPIFLRVESNGSFTVAHSSPTRESFDTNEIDVGNFEFSNGTLSFVSDADSPNCAGQVGTYTVTFNGENQFETHVIEDECAPFRGDSRDSPWTWSKISD